MNQQSSHPSGRARGHRYRLARWAGATGVAAALVAGTVGPAHAESNAHCGTYVVAGIRIGDPKCVAETGLLFRLARTPTCGDRGRRSGAASETGSVIFIHNGWTRTTYTTGEGVHYLYQWLTDLGGLQYGVRVCKP